ncbi:MAG TPA: energy transducer TonB, partial [Acetobacteraceae bacterium]|nr:energy transducer TonB [Acetobacteraceae bacterium]
QAHRSYPEEARRRAEQGTVLIRFTVNRDGQVLAVSLVQGSGSPALDEAAQAILRGARLPPFTADMPEGQTTVTVPIRYRLEG